MSENDPVTMPEVPPPAEALGLCGVPESMEVGHAPAIGSGNWPGCHGVGDFHAARVAIDETGMPDFLRPHFPEVWRRVVAMYRDIGLLWIRDDTHQRPNVRFSWVQRSSGWIGLAIIGQGQSCQDEIWCRYLASYRGGSTDEQIIQQWTTLVAHELGHNAGLPHSNGGIMNPSIVPGLPPSWAGDPSESTLRRWYGGEPVPGPEPPKDDDVTNIIKQLLAAALQWLLRWLNSGGLERLDEQLKAALTQITIDEKPAKK